MTFGNQTTLLNSIYKIISDDNDCYTYTLLYLGLDKQTKKVDMKPAGQPEPASLNQ